MAPSRPKLACIGDIHGHFDELIGLYHQLLAGGFDPQRDTLVQLGDLVDGGPDTQAVVTWCMAMAKRYPHWVFLKGNHGDLMLDALLFQSRTYGSYHLWWGQGGQATAQSYLPHDASAYERALMHPCDYIPLAHLVWLAARPLYYATDRYLFVHAGLRPGVPLAKQDRRDLLWIRDEFIEAADDFGGKQVVFGHTPLREPLVLANKIGIDTMGAGRGKLTAVELSGPEPVFYHQEATAGPWPPSIPCRFSDGAVRQAMTAIR
jgi:serine/threonine protein phosphatase 1